jgi:hypothetical protein
MECAGRAKRRRRFGLHVFGTKSSKAVSRYACHRTPCAIGRFAGSVFSFCSWSWGFAALHPRLYAAGRFAGSVDIGGFDPGAYALGFMPACAARTLARASGVDSISQTNVARVPLASWLFFSTWLQPCGIRRRPNLHIHIPSNPHNSHPGERFSRWGIVLRAPPIDRDRVPVVRI